MRPFSDSIKSELLCSRSSGRSFSRSSFFLLGFLSGFLGFLGFLCFLSRSFFFFFHFSSRSSGRSSSGGSVSSENNASESNSNESSNDGGYDFFHFESPGNVFTNYGFYIAFSMPTPAKKLTTRSSVVRLMSRFPNPKNHTLYAPSHTSNEAETAAFLIIRLF